MAIHVSLGFAQLKDKDLLPFTPGVVTGLTGNADFPTPPVTATVLDGHRKIFEDALSQAFKGSVADTTAKEEARAVLIDDLRQDAAYVEKRRAVSPPKSSPAGYLTMEHTHSPMATMPKTKIKEILNYATTQLLVRVEPIDNAYAFEVQVQSGAGPWQTAATSSQARGIVISGLAPGTTYNVHVRAIGAGQTYGEWSDVVVHICT